MNKKTIINNFSKYAHLYDRYSDVQNMVASKLLERSRGDFVNILEIGCGTGNYTLLLREKFKGASIKAIDLSEAMIEVSKSKFKRNEATFLVADGETVEFRENFDLITSNACFQWFENLDSALLRYKNMLRPEGVISFSIFGPKTFQELADSLNAYMESSITARRQAEVKIASGMFVNEKHIRSILKKHLKNVSVEEFNYQETFEQLGSLFAKIKYSGIKGEGLGNKIHFSPGVVKTLENIYRDKFGSIKATHQAFLCSGKI